MTSTIQSIPVDPTPPASGEGLIFNGTVYVPTPANPGDITAVNTTLPLTGGGVSGALTLDINNFTGDAGAGGLDGAVPAPAAGDAAAGKFLKADGVWTVPPAGGVTILANVTDNASVQAVVSTEVDIISSGLVACTAGKTQIVVLDCDYFAGQDNYSDNHFQLYADAAQIGGKDARHYISNLAFIFPVTVIGVATGLAAGNHTFKATVTMYPGGGGAQENGYTNSFAGSSTRTRLLVLEV